MTLYIINMYRIINATGSTLSRKKQIITLHIQPYSVFTYTGVCVCKNYTYTSTQWLSLENAIMADVNVSLMFFTV